MANSPRDSRRYTDAQVAAIMRAHLIDGHIISDVWRMAEAGQLGVPAFKVDRRYIYHLVKNNRDAFEAENPEALARSTEKALAAAHKANLDALRALAKDADPAERARVAKAVAETARTLTATQPKTRTSKDTHANPREPRPRADLNHDAGVNTPQPADTLANLIALAGKDQTRGAETGSLGRARSDADPASSSAA